MRPGPDDPPFPVSFRVNEGEWFALCGSPPDLADRVFDALRYDLRSSGGGAVAAGAVASVPKDLDAAGTVRRLVTRLVPAPIGDVAARLLDAEEAMASGGEDAGLEVAGAVATWAAVGGYELEDDWRRASESALDTPWDEAADRPADRFPTPRLRLFAILVALGRPTEVALVHSPELAVAAGTGPAVVDAVRRFNGTLGIVTASDDLLRSIPQAFVTVTPDRTDVFRGTFADYRAAVSQRQRRLETFTRQWHEEERRLYQHFRTMKERAAINSKNARQGHAAETRWKRFVEEGPPTAGVDD